MERISVGLIVKNEEKHIRQCLENLTWADEIVILDGYSTDRTLDIAREFTDKIYQKEFSGSFPQERQYLLTKTSNKWVFMVDGDMVIPEELKEEIKERFSSSVDEYAAFNLRHLNIYLGKEIRHCGWYEPNNTRIFNKEKGNYDTHMKYIDTFMPQGDIGIMSNHILHFGFETISEHLLRMDRYSTLNAQDLETKGYRISVFNSFYSFIIRPLIIFLYKFIYKRGFLDGREGLIICFMSAVTYAVSYFKLWEMQKRRV